MDLAKHCIVRPGSNVRLKKLDPDETFGTKRSDKALEKSLNRLRELQLLLYADKRYSLLIVLQGLDAAGKDGTIRHVMSGVNPQGCDVTSFKAPSSEELARDYLWRIHSAVPPRGTIGIFNRSHYEDVLIERVHELVPPGVWKKRYAQINDFETMLTDNNVCILKFFLHMSSKEQRRRFDERLADPRKNWKASPADFKEREYWAQYQAAYQDAIAGCGTKEAPWYVIPSDHKWFRNFAVGEIVVRTLESFKMHYPKPDNSRPHDTGGDNKS